jgi:hypothetical protein
VSLYLFVDCFSNLKNQTSEFLPGEIQNPKSKIQNPKSKIKSVTFFGQKNPGAEACTVEFCGRVSLGVEIWRLLGKG